MLANLMLLIEVVTLFAGAVVVSMMIHAGNVDTAASGVGGGSQGADSVVRAGLNLLCSAARNTGVQMVAIRRLC